MAPGIRPADPRKKGGEGSATGPPATASGAPPAYETKEVQRAGAPRKAGAACYSQSHPRFGETVVGTRTLLASQRPSYLERRRVAGAGRPRGSATPGRTRRRCRNGVRSGRPGGYMMPPHADDYLHPTQLVSIRVHERSEILACTGGTTVYRSERRQPPYS